MYVLDEISVEILQNTYKSERSERIIVRIREFWEPLLPILGDKGSSSGILVEYCSKFLLKIVSNSFLVKEFKKNVLDIFN